MSGSSRPGASTGSTARPGEVGAHPDPDAPGHALLAGRVARARACSPRAPRARSAPGPGGRPAPRASRGSRRSRAAASPSRGSASATGQSLPSASTAPASSRSRIRNARAARSGPSRSFQLPLPSPRSAARWTGCIEAITPAAGIAATRSSGSVSRCSSRWRRPAPRRRAGRRRARSARRRRRSCASRPGSRRGRSARSRAASRSGSGQKDVDALAVRVGRLQPGRAGVDHAVGEELRDAAAPQLARARRAAAAAPRSPRRWSRASCHSGTRRRMRQLLGALEVAQQVVGRGLAVHHVRAGQPERVQPPQLARRGGRGSPASAAPGAARSTQVLRARLAQLAGRDAVARRRPRRAVREVDRAGRPAPAPARAGWPAPCAGPRAARTPPRRRPPRRSPAGVGAAS